MEDLETPAAPPEASEPVEPAEPDAMSVEEFMPAEPEPAAVSLEDAQLRAVLEAIVYVAEEPLTLAQIAAALQQPAERIRALLDQVIAEFDKPEHGVTIREVAGGYKMATKPEHHEAVRNFVKSLKPPLKLSLPALETLAVIAYKQPVTGPEIMEIRGVQGGGVLKTLLDRKLIAVAGRKNVIGKPMLYKTTKEFLIQFGLKDLSELPSLKEFEEIRRMAFTEETPNEPISDPEAKAAEQVTAVSDEPIPEPVEAKSGTARSRSRRPEMPEERLQKILSQAGVASRRQAEKIMLEGRVTVNGKIVTELGSKADLEQRPHQGRRPPAQASQAPDLHRPEQAQQHRHHGQRSGRPDDGDGIAPRRQGAGLSRGTPRLPQRRPAAADQRRRDRQRHHVGRDSPDQDLRGQGHRHADRRQEEQFRHGVPLSGKRTMPAGLKLIKQGDNPWYEVKLTEGRNQQIRLMFKHFGFLVEKLRRVRIGPIELGPIKPGQFRHLTDEEVQKLKRAIERGRSGKPRQQEAV